MSDIYIKCRHVKTDDEDIQEKKSPLMSIFDTSSSGSRLDSSSSSVILIVFSIFLLLFIYFIGKFIFKNTPDKLVTNTDTE